MTTGTTARGQEGARMGTQYPTEFRGCMWNDGWEFEAPCVVYFPARYAAFKSDGNTGGIDYLVERITDDIAEGIKHCDGGLAKECEWRGWGKRFAKRRDAWHVVIKGHWTCGSDGRIEWNEDSRTEVFGLTARTNEGETK